MLGPRLARIAKSVGFAVVLLASAAVREGPGLALNQAVIWLPTGVAVAGLLLLGMREAWTIALVTFLQRLVLGYDASVALPAAAGSAFEAVLGVLVLRRLGFRASLDRLRDVAALLAAAALAPLGSILFSWIGRTYAWTDRNLPFYSGWDGWWRMNALGLLTVVPLAAAWSRLVRAEVTPRFVAATLGALVGVPALLFAAMFAVPPGTTGVMDLNLVLVLVLYVAVRFGIRGATLAGVLAAITVAIATTYGVGPFMELPLEQRHVALQLFELSFVAVPPAFSAILAERRAALERGTRSDALRRSIEAVLPDVLYRISRDGTCLDVSMPRGAELLYQPDEVIGRSILEVLPRERHDELRRAVEAAFANGQVATVEFEITREGRRFHREARCVPLGQDEIVAVVRDITDRKWAEGETAFEARVLGRIAAGSPTAEVLAEIATGLERLAPDVRCTITVLEQRRLRVATAPTLPASIRDAIEGMAVDERAGSCGAAAVHDRPVVVKDLWRDPLAAPIRELAQAEGLRACWSVPVHDSKGAVLGTIAVFCQVAREPRPRELALAQRAATLAAIVLDRERGRAELARSEDLLASINRNVNEGLFRADPDFRLLFANPALARMLGFETPGEVHGGSLAAAFAEPAREEGLRRAIATSGHWLNEDVRLRRRDGSTFWGLLSGTAVRDEAGRILHYDGVVADVTERRGLEEQLRQSQKMEAVGKLAGGVAHDFNNLLTVIVGYADTIRTGSPDGSPARQHAQHVLEAATRASGLTRQLLAYSRQQMLAPRVLELTGIVERMAGMLRRLIGEDVRLVVRNASGPCWVLVDGSQIEQVLLNLVVNARDAMPAGGTLTLTTSVGVVDAERARTCEGLAEGPCVMLSVQDTGSGMTPDVQARAFDPFFTTKGPGEGTGLGLSTVYGIVRQSGGAVWLESAVGAGTVVRICLPRLDAPAPEPAVPARPRATGALATVLVVEDEAAVRELVQRTLERAGYPVLVAGDGVSALELANVHPAHIDLVVTDVVMPRMGGRELAARLLSTRPGLRFLFVSGYAEDAREPRDLAEAGNGFLSKPFMPEQLLERVVELVQARPSPVP